MIDGTLDTSDRVVMRAGRIGRDTLLSQIVQMVTTTQCSRTLRRRRVTR